MGDRTAKKCRALLDAARSDEPSADSLQRTAAALGLPAAVISVATTVSASSSAASHLSAAKAAGAAASKTAGLVTAAKGTGGLSLAALGATSVTTKFVSAVVLAAGGIVGVAEWQGRAPSPQETPQAHDSPSGAVATTASVASGPAQPKPIVVTPRVVTSEAPTMAESARSAASTQVAPGQSQQKPAALPTTPSSTKPRHARIERERPNPNTLDLEVAHLAKARTALMASKPEEALRWLEDYDRQFGAGVLLQEANILRQRAREAKASRECSMP
jgi:hypothetical protein